MTGIGAKASRVSCHEVTANTAPTRTMFQKVAMTVAAPTSRNRSSWLTSSLRTARTPPLALSSNQATSSSWMWV
jgi:hypothetical protein